MTEIKDLWLLGIERGKLDERERILSLLRTLRNKAQKNERLTTNVNINAIIALVKAGQE